MTELSTHTLDVPGATLTYDVRRNAATMAPVLLLIGSPMGASGFPTLAGHFTDRTIVTYDPRGVERSTRSDQSPESTPDQHADDLRRVISTLGADAVDIFASSGGAVNALALVAKHPEQVRTLVAHEPPAAREVPDREYALAAAKDIQETYKHSGFGVAMAKFIDLVGHKGLLTKDYAHRSASDPAAYGLPTEDDGSRNDPLLGQNIVTCTHYQFDFDALRAAPTRIVIAAGVESEGELAHRAAVGVADRLGTALVTFPSGHGGFLGDEYGQPGEPDAFAVRLREVLGTDDSGGKLGLPPKRLLD